MGRRSFLRSLARRFGYDLRRRSDLVQQSDPYQAQATLLAGQSVERVFDVGAHEGRTVARYGALFPTAQIDAFEPVAESHDALQKATGDRAHVTVHRLALGDQDGTLTLQVNRHADTSSAFAFSEEARRWMPSTSLEASAQQAVPVERLDTHCARRAVEHIDILKLDVQGYELAVLRGATGLLERGAIDLIFCEVEFVPVYAGQPLAHDVTAYLDGLGYRLFRFYETVYSPSGQLLWADALYLSPAQAAALSSDVKAYRQTKTMP